MTATTAMRVPASSIRNPDPAPDDHTLAGEVPIDRDYACLVVVTHLAPGDASRLRRACGTIGVVDSPEAADLYMVVPAASPRAARRVCVERVAACAPQAVVTVAEVVDYDAALVTFADLHCDFYGQLPDTFDDADAVFAVLDRA